MEIRVVQIGNGYVVYSDIQEQPIFCQTTIDVEIYAVKLLKEWKLKTRQKRGKNRE